MRLSATLWRWLSKHEVCIAEAVKIDGPKFDIVTRVPSTSSTTDGPSLATLVGGIVAGTNERFQETLRLNRADIGSHVLAEDKFIATTDLRGSSVLLIDDTWTTGASMQSASAALKRGGAQHVGGVVIGRWFTADYRDNAAWLRNARKAKWSWETCCLEAGLHEF
jgi:hypothetical protein